MFDEESREILCESWSGREFGEMEMVETRKRRFDSIIG